MSELNNNPIQLREMGVEETAAMIRYFLSMDADTLHRLGVNPDRLPAADDWQDLLKKDFSLPKEQRQFYYLACVQNDTVIGHCNINKIRPGEDAAMHLHLWTPDSRRKGTGTWMVQQSLPHFFSAYDLRTVYCEPHAENPAPNHTLPKAGFRFVKKYETVPGWINFRQFVNRWEISRVDLPADLETP